ncbi:MAG: tyrosine-type recombinase/integrase [Nocardioidaceae bacterium]|nr:MAG: tyrosine-type recombinase/integrase [Nocardioidaceae bacterium]
MSTGRTRLEIGTYGDISTTRTAAGTVRAEARFRDWDGEVRKVTATGSTVKTAKQALRQKLVRRNTATGLGTVLTPESTVAQLAAAWLEDVEVRTDLAPGTKDLYAREVRSLILPHLKSLRLREATVGRVDQFIKRQATVSYAHAKHSRRMLSMLFNFALRHDAVHHNPVAGASRLKSPNRKPQSLTYHQIEQVRRAAATWRTGKSVSGPRPDGQVRDVIEVLLGTSDRIGEALALRKCDIDDSRLAEELPMLVTVAGTLVVIKGKGVYRQDHPKTSNSRRTLEVPEFTAEVIRRRLQVIEDKGLPDDHLLFFTRNDTPLSPNNVRRTLRKMLKDAGLTDFKVTPHSFRRTSGTTIARATDAKTAAEVMGNTEEIAERHYIEPEQPKPNPAPAIHLKSLAPGASTGVEQTTCEEGDAA